MKRIVSVLLSLVMLFTLGSVCASASDDDVVLDFDDIVGETGFSQVYFFNPWVSRGEDTVELYIKNNPGIDKIDITLDLPDGVEILSVSDGDMGTATLSNGVITVTSTEEYTEDTCVANVTLNVKISENQQVKISCTASNGENAAFIAPSTCLLKVRQRIGDVDGDGDRDATDLANLKLHLAGAKAIGDEGVIYPDVNGDGEVVATDLAQLKLMLAGVEFDDSMKILAIGNSFSVDAMQHLYGIMEDGGVQNIVLGNLYIGGCSVNTHVNNLDNHIADYKYYKNTDGTWKTTENFSANEALEQEDWDIISIQQASALSGKADSFENLDALINHIKAVHPNAKIVWHMTWAYPQNSTSDAFVNYDKDQITMYNAIVDCVEDKILTNDSISKLMPVGTAIQNLRTSYLGDTLNRDKSHLSYGIGRYTAALTWYAVLTGKSIDNITFVPEDYPEIEENLPAIKDAVNKAIANPYEVTQSAYTE